MTSDQHEPAALKIPETPRGPSRWTVLGVVALLTVAASYGAWKAGLRPDRVFGRAPVALVTLPVDEGAVVAVVTENGTLESSNNATIRCEVEALLGVTGGGAPGMGGGMNNRQGGAQGAAGGQAGANGQNAQQQQQQQQQQQAAAKTKAATKAGAGGATKAAGGASVLTSKTAGGATGSAAAGGTAGASGSASGAGGASGASGGAQGANGASGGAQGANGATTAPPKPVIRSFTYQVAPYMPLKPKPTTTQAQPKQQVDPSMNGGRGGRGGNNQMQEKPGATRIISILPEGTRVKAGQKVAELDSAAFRDELQAQKIRHAQAKSYVEQAGSILEVNTIALAEYRDGIYPQDRQLIQQYLTTCRIEEERARKNLNWSQQTAAKGMRAPTQVMADRLALEQAVFALGEARGMAYRLEKFTAPRLIKNLEAKNEAIKADKLSLEAQFKLEDDRLRRLQKMVENCTLIAPRDGIVVYANQQNMWGRVENQIQEGVTVREGQALIELPDPRQMRVRAKVNESKVALIHTGQRAQIVIDAFPDQPLAGTVAEITPIPAPANGPFSDVKIYYAVVNIDSGGFETLRPGLSAEVNFLVRDAHKVTRVPLQAVRWVASKPFAAVAADTAAAPTNPAHPSWQWRSLALGQTDTMYAEVVGGLKPGDRVIANPDLLPAPRPSAIAPTVADASGRPRG